MKLICQECCGYGRVTEDYVCGEPRREVCGWCSGTGEVTPQMRGVWLQMKREEARVRCRLITGEPG